MLRSLVCLVIGIFLTLAPAAAAADLGQEILKGIGQQFEPKAQNNESKKKSETPATASSNEEVAVGRQIAGNLLGAAPLVKDKALQKYVNLVGRWVANQSERADLEWHFGVIDSTDINAFSIPGGYVFVTRGLYALLNNEAQLAGVLAHEIAHVVKQHHYRLIQQGRIIDIGGKWLSHKAGQNNQLVQNLIGSGAEIMARGLDKNAEYEADRMGVVLAARAGYDQYALPEVLQQMGHYSSDDDSVKLLFKTHPLPDDRLHHLDISMDDRLDNLKGATVSNRFYKLRN